MTVHSLDAPRVSRRIALPLHRATPDRVMSVIDRLQREIQTEADLLPEPRRQVVYITYEEVSEWRLPPPSNAA